MATRMAAAALVVWTIAAGAGWAEDAKPTPEPARQSTTIGKAKAAVKDGAKAIGHATRDVTRAIGHATRDTAKAIGHGTRDAARGTKKAVEDAWNEATGKDE